MSTRIPQQEPDRSDSGSDASASSEVPKQLGQYEKHSEAFTSEEDALAAEMLSSCTCTSRELARSCLIEAATELGAKGLNQDDVCCLAFDICSKRGGGEGADPDNTACPPPRNIIREQDLEFERSARLDQEKEQKRKNAALEEDKRRGEAARKVKEVLNEKEERTRRLSLLRSNTSRVHAADAIGADIVLRFPDGYRCPPETFLTTDPMQRVIDLARIVYLDRILTDLPPSSACSSPNPDEVFTRLGGLDLDRTGPDGTGEAGTVPSPPVTPLALFDGALRRLFVDGKTEGDLAKNGIGGKTVLWVVPPDCT